MSSPVASSAEKSDPPKRKRGWRWLLQFRLRTILILTTVVAIWLGWWLDSARQQREAVAELRKVGAFIFYDFRPQGYDRPFYYPAWLVNWLGVDCFAGVRAVTHRSDAIAFSIEQMNDADLAHVKTLTSLRSLRLHSTQVTDAGLEHLKGLTSLQSLYIINTQVSDVGLEHLKGLSSLQILWLVDTQVTDAGVARLQESLPNCVIRH